MTSTVFFEESVQEMADPLSLFHEQRPHSGVPGNMPQMRCTEDSREADRQQRRNKRQRIDESILFEVALSHVKLAQEPVGKTAE